MIFSSVEFVIFFALVLIIHWGVLSMLPLGVRERSRHFFLLAASFYFYMSWNAAFVLLILGSTLVDFIAGLYIDRATTAWRRKLGLIISLACNLGILAFFKYM